MITCIVCGCTDENACVDKATGETCAWIEFQPGVAEIRVGSDIGMCSFCAEERDEDPGPFAADLHAALDRGLNKPTDAERGAPLVEVYSDLEATRFLRARRAGA